MGDFEELLGDMGAKQWVKNKFVAQLRAFKTAGSVNVDKFIADFDRNILAEFKVVANEAVDETIKRADELLTKAK